MSAALLFVLVVLYLVVARFSSHASALAAALTLVSAAFMVK